VKGKRVLTTRAICYVCDKLFENPDEPVFFISPGFMEGRDPKIQNVFHPTDRMGLFFHADCMIEIAGTEITDDTIMTKMGDLVWISC